MIHPPGDQASYYTLLSVVGCALKYLPAVHSSETDTHEQALRLQMAVALHLIPHIRNCLSTIVANREVSTLLLNSVIVNYFITESLYN